VLYLREYCWTKESILVSLIHPKNGELGNITVLNRRIGNITFSFNAM
jgi:hypothetical protein